MHERLYPVVEMVLSARYVERVFVESRLLTAAAAAEGLHRRLAQATYMPDDEFTEVMNALKEVIPQSRTRWLTDRLRNEPTFKQRLEMLVASVGEDIVHPLLPKPNRWAAQTLKSRNLLAHVFDESDNDDDPLNQTEMYYLAELTTAVVTFVLLKELGLSKEKLAKLAGTHPTYQFLVIRVRRHLPWLIAGKRPRSASAPSDTGEGDGKRDPA